MDKYEYKLKLDQLKNLISVQDYSTAAEIAGTINWKKVRNSNTLVMVAGMYEALGEYEECKSLLLQAYDHSSIGRNIVYKLTTVAIKSKNVDEAEEYYQEFVEIAPRDNRRFVLAYQICCLRKDPITDRIAVLEELKEKEYTEVWAYELAALYSMADMREKCVETCDELVLWFGDGEYVEKALDLKLRYQPLTASQEEKYQQFRAKRGVVEINIPKKAEATISEESGLPEITVTASKFNTVNLQEELAKSMQIIMEATDRDTVADTMGSIKKVVNDIPYLNGDADIAEQKDQELLERAQINEAVDEKLSVDFQNFLGEEKDGQINLQIPENKEQEQQVAGQMSIEDVLADWEKTKRAAEAAIAAAEQNKLALEKTQAMIEANEIMDRLKALLPYLTPAEGEMEDTDITATMVGSTVKAAEETEAVEEAAPAEEAAAEEKAVEEAAAEEPESQDAEVDETEAILEEAMAELSQEEETSVEPEENAGDTLILPELDLSGVMDEEAPAEDTVEQEIPTEEMEEEETEILPEISTDEIAAMMEEETPAEEPVAEETVPEEMPVEENPVQDETAVLPEISIPEEIEEEIPEEDKAKPIRFYNESNIMTRECEELFSYFMPVPGMKEQLVDAMLTAVQNGGSRITSLSGNLIVQGEEGSGKTVLATSLIKAIQKLLDKEDSKIGKISAESLNKKNFESLIPKLEGGYLIVDKAGSLTAETAAKMSAAMEKNTQGLTVILEDDSAGIRRALALDKGFAKKFTNKVKIPIFTIDELVEFGKSYATEMECEIEEMAVLALYNRINNIKKLDQPTTLTQVKEIVDQAIESAEAGGLKKLFAKRYTDGDYLILRESDFE